MEDPTLDYGLFFPPLEEIDVTKKIDANVIETKKIDANVIETMKIDKIMKTDNTIAKY
tara:strand:- start:355 stop:528 length:174 start_codon:yes stop_codon:yes gene_type:complete